MTEFCVYVSQDAKKGVLFIDFPPVLQLQLKRFEYDFMRDTMVKVGRDFLDTMQCPAMCYQGLFGKYFRLRDVEAPRQGQDLCVWVFLRLMVAFNRFSVVQINDRYEFPLQLDLDRENGKYLSPDADRSVRNLYTLHRFGAYLAYLDTLHYKSNCPVSLGYQFSYAT